MTPDQTRELIFRGFTGKLKYKVVPEYDSQLVNRIAWLTDRIPQQIHELCLEIALAGEGTKLIDADLVDRASSNWAKTSLMSNYSAISDLMNARRTNIGRRNQTLYALGQYDGEDFTYNDIESIIRREFVEDTGYVTLNISQILSELSSRENPLIRRTPSGNAYRFTSPKYRMCLRTILRKAVGERVEKLDFGSLSDG